MGQRLEGHVSVPSHYPSWPQFLSAKDQREAKQGCLNWLFRHQYYLKSEILFCAFHTKAALSWFQRIVFNSTTIFFLSVYFNLAGSFCFHFLPLTLLPFLFLPSSFSFLPVTLSQGQNMMNRHKSQFPKWAPVPTTGHCKCITLLQDCKPLLLKLFCHFCCIHATATPLHKIITFT